jgi:hypothetical protein
LLCLAAIELVGPQYRGFVTVMTCLAYVMGMLMLSGVAFLIRDWVHLSYATALPFFLYCGYWWYVCELFTRSFASKSPQLT